jgi:hypothetical protein
MAIRPLPGAAAAGEAAPGGWAPGPVPCGVGDGVRGTTLVMNRLANGPDGTRPFMAATCHSNIPVTKTSTIASPRRWPEEKRSGLLSWSGG